MLNKFIKVKPWHTRKILNYSDRLIMCEVHIDRGIVIDKHSHHPEQMGYVVRGKALMNINGKSKIYEEEQSCFIPGQSEHSTEGVEDTIVIDVFCPPMAESR